MAFGNPLQTARRVRLPRSNIARRNPTRESLRFQAGAQRLRHLFVGRAVRHENRSQFLRVSAIGPNWVYYRQLLRPGSADRFLRFVGRPAANRKDYIKE